MTQGIRSTSALGSLARPCAASCLWSADVLSQTRRGLSRCKSRETPSQEPDCGTQTLSPLEGKGEAAKARATPGKRGSKTEPCLLLPVHFGYLDTAQREEPGITTPTEAVTIGAWPGWGRRRSSPPPKGGHCSYNISLSLIS